MTQIATVEKILPGGMAEISVPRKSACGHDCEECAGCGMTGAAIKARAKNDPNAQPGEKVVVESSTKKLLGVVALVILIILPELLRSFSDYRMVVYSLALVVMMIFRPKGLLGSYDFSLSRSLETFLNRLLGRTENPKKEAADNE